MKRENSNESPRSTAGGDLVQLRDYQRGVPSDGDDTRGYPAELAGRRFDEIVVQKLVSRRSKFHRPESEGHRLWRCRCDCGATLLRTTAWIHQRVRDDRPLACSLCLGELSRGKSHFRSDWKRIVWADQWALHGTLYSTAAVEWITRDVREKLEAEYGPPVVRDTDRVAWGVPEEPWTPPRSPKRPQQDAYLYRLRPEPDPDLRYMHVFLCIDCGKKSEAAYGCIQCMEPVCVTCVNAEDHACGERFRSSGYTLEEVGEVLGISRGRVGQLQDRALAQIAQQLRSDSGEMRDVWWPAKKPISKPAASATSLKQALAEKISRAEKKKVRLRLVKERARAQRWKRTRLALGDAFVQVGLAVEMWDAQHNHPPPGCSPTARCARQMVHVAPRDPDAALRALGSKIMHDFIDQLDGIVKR